MKNFLAFLSGKRLFFCTLGVVIFFGLVILDWCLPDTNWAAIVRGIIEFLGNMFMLPMLLCFYPGFLIVSVIHCVRERFRIKSWALGSLVILLLCNPFFVKKFIDHCCM